MYYKRIVDDILKEKFKYIGGVYVKGPKWVGKTTTRLNYAKKHL